MLLHYLVKYHSFDTASQIVHHTHDTSIGFSQSHPLVTEENYFKFGQLNIADKTHGRQK